uniref:TetR/AcrR family transcriptional regulator n=2 Tax=Thermocrispum agreste TaxID=37925 RepID=A0A2W4JR40_9PSEU|nr:MAG: TetR/AcrR family transcriptional regulator [Thermocrispum agreste]
MSHRRQSTSHRRPRMAKERTEHPRDVLLTKIVEWFMQHGVLDTSMRTLAAGVGTSNRMLHYHFGSRDQLLSAVIERVCAAERETLHRFIAEASDPFDAGARYWRHVADTSAVFAPLFFELSSHAMYRKPYAESLRTVLTDAWLTGFTQAFQRVTSPDRAARLARLSLAVGRGVLFEMALTGDRAAADAAVEEFTTMVRREVQRDG